MLCFILQSGKQFGGPGKDKGDHSKLVPTEHSTDQEPELIPGLEIYNNPWDLSHSKLGKTMLTGHGRSMGTITPIGSIQIN